MGLTKKYTKMATMHFLRATTGYGQLAQNNVAYIKM
jgi:hypothetical protein